MSLDWAEKYRPRKLSEVIGNPGALKLLADWAEAWGTKAMKRRAALLVGKPGIGKTTTAHALANERNWGVVELNASDQRNAKAIEDVALRGAIGETFTVSGEFRSSAKGERKLIILDEADNVAGREDFGGYRAITDMVKNTRQPVILIANDYYELRRRAGTLESLCLVIKFETPRQASVVRRLSEICRMEGVQVSASVLEAVAAKSGGDIRSAVNDLQTALTGKVGELSEKDLGAISVRDVQMSAFDAVRKVFSAKDFKKAREATRDIEEEPGDFLTWMEHNVSVAIDDPRDLAAAYEALARSDVFLQRAEKMKAYVFWSYATDMMTAGVALSRRAPMRQGYRYEYPMWIRRMSSSKGKRAARRSLGLKLARYTHSSSREVLLDSFPLYASMFRQKGSVDLRTHLLNSLALTEEEVAYMLDSDIGEEDVARAMAEARSPAKVEKKAEKPAADSGESEDGKQEPVKQKSLGDY